jgi:hypothetical protein
MMRQDRIRRVGLMMALVLGIFASAGCSKPCTDLAERVCEKAGVQSDECLKSTAQAKEARTDEQQACGRVMEMVETLSKTK